MLHPSSEIIYYLLFQASFYLLTENIKVLTVLDEVVTVVKVVVVVVIIAEKIKRQLLQCH